MNQGKQIMVVEDEAKLADVLIDYLHSAGYTTTHFDRGSGVVEQVKSDPPALILLDLMLPGKDGMDICREIRAFSNVPIIMVTAKVEEIDRLLGLELGADDYVCKPYSPREVLARVKAVLRRTDTSLQPNDSSGQGLVLDETRFLAKLNDQPLDLTPVEFRLLKALTALPGRVFSRAQLLEHLYTDGRVVCDRTVDTHIKNLRKKLEEKLPEQEIIHSIYGIGYKLEIEL